MRRLRLIVACLVGVPALVATGVAVHEITAGAPSQAPSASSAPSPALPTAGNGRFLLLQMNLCLSGLAPCLQYPQVLGEAVTVIRTRRPNAVTLNEVCEGDVARIAARTGYHRRFTTVLYRGRPLPCRSPAGRGVFGNAVLTRGTIRHSDDGRYTAQDVLEQRRWLCVTTVRPVTVCTTHLEAIASLATLEIRRRQCAELTDLLAARAGRGPTVAAGDINAVSSCAPRGMWTRTDHGASQKPALQQTYGSTADFLHPLAGVVSATFTDHDFLLVSARLVRRPSL
jgi:endonuclease/exonuclease/phosphatase family metal-dependent hydrolase